jgi:hypothetical protein
MLWEKGEYSVYSPFFILRKSQENIIVKKWNVLYVIAFAFVIFFYLIASWTILPRRGHISIPGEGVYSGQLRGKTFHGQGTWLNEFGVTYTGEFKNGVFHGQGTMAFANGSTYEGEFKDGFMHGHGVMTFPDGRKQEGEWDSDQFQGGYITCDHDYHDDCNNPGNCDHKHHDDCSDHEECNQ